MDRPLSFDGYEITPFPVAHSLHVKSVGYVIKKGPKSIFYTGDIAYINEKLLTNIGRQDMIITEASYIRRGGLVRHKDGKPFGHLGVPDLVALFAKRTTKIVFTHFGSWFVKNVEAGAAKIKAFETDALKLIVAEDGTTIRV
jgi:phosphoribosyl 1,2-cyclic phosphodiesterase